MKMYEVGGCVRDEIMGVPSNDIDFTVVMELTDLDMGGSDFGPDDPPFKIMSQKLRRLGFTIFTETPEFLCIKGQFPKTDEYAHYAGKVADFVMARREGAYTDGRRPDLVIPGTLQNDLARRDFTMNAIAKAADGSYIDPFNGRGDIDDRVIRAVGDPVLRLQEDALRAVRALRFAVTKKFAIDRDLEKAMQDEAVLDAIRNKISDERIQQELSKMFRYDTLDSLGTLYHFPHLNRAIFSGKVSLDATLKQKGRGK